MNHKHKFLLPLLSWLLVDSPVRWRVLQTMRVAFGSANIGT